MDQVQCYGYFVFLDGSSNVYIAGQAQTGYPTTSGAHSETYNGGFRDAVVSKFNSTLSSLTYSTYIGGDDTDYLRGATINSSGNVYIVGTTNEGTTVDYPTTPGAYIEEHNGGIYSSYDGFLTKLNTSGTDLDYSTFIGTNYHQEDCQAVALDGEGMIYIVGLTYSTDFPTTSGAYDESHNGSDDAFVVKFKIAPEAIENLSVEIDGQGYGLSWSASGMPNATYNVYRSTTSATYSTALATDLSSTTYTDTDIDQDENYYYVVTATADDNEGDWSNEVCTDNVRDTLFLSVSMVNSRTLYVSEAFSLDFVVTDQNEAAIEGVDIVVYEGFYVGQEWVVDNTLSSDASGEATNSSQIPDDISTNQVTCAGRARLWPYKTSTVASININTTAWSTGFTPEDNGFNFANTEANLWSSTWQSYICDDQPYENQNFISLYPASNTFSLDCEYFPDWTSWEDAFGIAQCKIDEDTYASGAVEEWAEYYGEYGGSCFGIAINSLLYYSDLLTLPSGCDNAYDITLGNDPRALVNKYYVYQFGDETIDWYTEVWDYTPSETVDTLIDHFLGSASGYMTTRIQSIGAHAVLPYKVLRTSSTDTVYVYDPNYPNDLTKKIIIDRSQDEWSYSPSGWSNLSSGFMPEMEIQEFTSVPTLPIIMDEKYIAKNRPLLGPSDDFVRIYFNQDAKIDISTSNDRKVDNQDNWKNGFGKAIRSMYKPGMPIIGFNAKKQNDNIFKVVIEPKASSFNHFKFLTGDDFMISLNYQVGGVVNKQLFDIDLLDQSISMSASHENQILNTSLIKTMENHERIWRINNSSLDIDDVLTMNMEQDGRDLIVSNQGQTKLYDLVLIHNSSDFDRFEYLGLKIIDNDIHVLRVTNWQNLQDSILLIKYADLDMSEPYSIECLNCLATDVLDQGNIDVFNIKITPHPIKGRANIQYYIPEAGDVSIELYSAIGEIATVITKKYHAVGNYSIEYDCSNLSSGAYLYKIISGKYSSSGKIIINK